MKPSKINVEIIANRRLEIVVYKNITIETAIKKVKEIQGFMYITTHKGF